MGEVYKKAKEVFEKELEKIVDKGDINPTNLEFAYKLVDIIKDIGEICEMDDEMYDEESSGRRMYGMRRSRRYPYMGNYTVEGSYGRGYSGADGGYGSNSNYGGNSYGGRSSGTSAMHSKLQRLLDEASTDRERMMIQSWMDDLMV